MAITHASATRGALAQAVLDDVDADASVANCLIRESTTVLATIALTDPSFSRSGAVLTLLNTPRTDSSADANGTADNFIIQDGAGVDVILGSVTATGGGGDIELDSVSITAGQSVSITGGTYTAPV